MFVVTRHESPSAVAYYAWCMAQLTATAAPARLCPGAGRYPQPVVLLARLGSTLAARSGLGAGLVQDVFARIVELSADIGCRDCWSIPSQPRPVTSTSTSSQSSGRVRRILATSCC